LNSFGSGGSGLEALMAATAASSSGFEEPKIEPDPEAG
jgi:hypothetical protein